jgi:3'-5' exonuclease
MAALPKLTFPGRIKIVSDAATEAEAVKVLSAESLLGYDTEAKPSDTARNPPCLIQLASQERCFIWRVEAPNIPESLRSILTDTSIVKVSQGAIGEVKSLYTHFQLLQPRGFVCLHNLATALRCAPKSLQGLSAIFLKQYLDKSLCTSDWAAPTLCEAQLIYAANDAWATLQVLRAMRASFKCAQFPQEIPISLESLGILPNQAEPQLIVAASGQAELVKLAVAKGFKIRMTDISRSSGGYSCTLNLDKAGKSTTINCGGGFKTLRSAQGAVVNAAVCFIQENS